jgi:hypothetical protein
VEAACAAEVVVTGAAEVVVTGAVVVEVLCGAEVEALWVAGRAAVAARATKPADNRTTMHPVKRAMCLQPPLRARSG